MSIRNEHLSVIIALNKVDQPGNPFLIKLFKHIIQQKDGREVLLSTDRLILRQLQCEEEAFALPLRGAAFHGMLIQQEQQIIPVNTVCGPLQLLVAKPVRAEER